MFHAIRHMSHVWQALTHVARHEWKSNFNLVLMQANGKYQKDFAKMQN